MPRDLEPARVECIILEEREKSLHVRQEQPRGGNVDVWLPRSQLEHISKDGKDKETGHVKARIEMPEWLADQNNLNYT